MYQYDCGFIPAQGIGERKLHPVLYGKGRNSLLLFLFFSVFAESFTDTKQNLYVSHILFLHRNDKLSRVMKGDVSWIL